MRGPSTSLVAIAVSFLTLCSYALFNPSVAYGQTLTYDIGLDFSTNSNPNGVWSYGEYLSNDNLAPFCCHSSTNNLIVWGYLLPVFDGIAYNGTTNTEMIGPAIWQPGQLGVQRGFYPIDIRWTAPSNALYTITAAFVGIDTNAPTEDVSVHLKSTPIFDGLVAGYGAQFGTSYASTQDLVVGDTVDFLIASNTPNNNVEIGLAATIAAIPPGNADLGVMTVASPMSAISQSNEAYTITITNLGPDQALQVVVTNVLPAGVRLTGYDIPAGDTITNLGAAGVAVSFWSLGSGASHALTITGQVNCATADGALLTNSVNVSSRWNDSVTANNRVTTITTNHNPPGSVCDNSFVMAELYRDKVVCGHFGCNTEPSGKFTISVVISLGDVDTSGFNQSTRFDLSIGGNFTFSHALGDDPRYTTQKTKATFTDLVVDERSDNSKLIKYLTTSLKWTNGKLTAKIRGTISLDGFPVLADRYYDDPTGPIADTAAAKAQFGSVIMDFDPLNISGGVATVDVFKGGDDFPVSAVIITASGHE